MMVLVLAVLSGIVGAMAVPPRARLGYSVSSALIVLTLGTAIPQAGVVNTIIAAVITMTLPVLTAARPLRAHSSLWCYVLVAVIGSVAALAAGGINPFVSYVMLLGAALAVVASSMSRREWTAVWTVIVVVSAIVAVVLVVEAFVVRGVLFVDEAYGTNPFLPGIIRAQAMIGHPLVASFVCVLGLFVLLRSDVRLVLKLLLTPLFMAGVVATGSSTTVVTVAVGIVGWFLVGRAAKLSVLRITALVLLVLGVAIVSFTPSALLDDISPQQSAHRLNSLRAIPALLSERGISGALFGSGFGSAESLYRAGIFDNDGFFAIDNQFVSVLASAGLIGAILFIVFLLGTLRRAPALDRVFLLTLLLVFLGFDVLDSPSAGPLFLVFAAAAGASRTPDRSDESEEASSLQRSVA